MNNKLSASSLLAKVKQDQESAAAVKACWEASLPVPAPSQFDLLQMVRTVSLDHLVAGMDSYAILIAKKAEARERLGAEGKALPPDKYPLTTLNAKNYVCSTGRNLDEEEDPQDRPETERRRRRAMATLERPEDFNAWHDGTGAERQKALGVHIATEKAKPRNKRKGFRPEDTE
jgi:hypothetical protein